MSVMSAEIAIFAITMVLVWITCWDTVVIATDTTTEHIVSSIMNAFGVTT